MYRQEATIRRGLTHEQYHAIDLPSRSSLFSYRSCPYRYRYGEVVETEPMRFGSYFHCCLLTPHETADRFLIHPDMTRRGKNWDPWVAQAAEEGKTLIPQKEADKVESMIRLMIEPFQDYYGAEVCQSLYGEPCETELVIEFDLLDMIRVKCAIDAYYPQRRTITDLKKSKDSNPKKSSYGFRQYGYHWQQYIYTAAIKAAFGHDADMVFLYVEDSHPHIVTPMSAQEDLLMTAELELIDTICRYIESVEGNIWPVYTDGIAYITNRGYVLDEQ